MSSGIPTNVDVAPKVTIEIGGQRLSGWTGVTVTRTIDAAADAFAISMPWNPTAENLTRFRPYQYQIVRIWLDDMVLLTGTIDRVSTGGNPASREMQIDGRSAPGILVDVSAGPPWQYEGVKFSQICRAIGNYYGVIVQVPPIEDVGPISVVEVDPGQTAFDFLSQLGAANGLKPRALDPSGSLNNVSTLQFTDTSALALRGPIADLVEGSDPVIAISADYDATKRYSRYDAIQEQNGEILFASAADDIPATRVSAGQPRQASADIQAAANAYRARGYFESFGAQVTVTGWTYNGTFWAPGGVITATAPSAMIRPKGRLMIRQATYRMDETSGQVCDLQLVLPEALSNTTPRSVPWYA